MLTAERRYYSPLQSQTTPISWFLSLFSTRWNFALGVSFSAKILQQQRWKQFNFFSRTENVAPRARLVTSCQQVWNKLLTTCNNLVDIVRIVTRLFQQGCYNHDITILLQPCVVNLVTFLLYHDCIRLVRTTL